jgi:uncharacterized protein involved in outer membrane biogenesis
VEKDIKMHINFRKSLLGFLVFAVLCVAGLKLYFTSDRLRAVLVPQMSAALKRPVALQAVGLGFWGGVHVSVSGLQVAERPAFGTLPFLRVAEANIFVEFWPLLLGDVVIAQIRLVGPQVSVVVLKSGEANYADLSQGSDDASGEGSALSVHDVVIEDGVVLYADLGKQTQIQL